jgi:DNA-directed RNA polymerase subunit RPC12/RpoP
MSDEIIQPRINLKEQPTIVCGDCGGMFFKEVSMLKKVSKILTGASEDTIVPFPTYICNKCGHVNEEFQLFDN